MEGGGVSKKDAKKSGGDWSQRGFLPSVIDGLEWDGFRINSWPFLRSTYRKV